MLSSELVAKLYEEVDTEEKANGVIQIVDNCRKDIHNNNVGITEDNLEDKLCEWLDNKHYIDKKDNHYYVYYYDKQDYEDYISEDKVKEIISGKTLEERIENYNSEVYDEYWTMDYINETIWNLASEFCNDTGYEQHDTEVQDILVNIFEVDFSTYLNTEYNVNLLIDFNNVDSNTEFTNTLDLENENSNLRILLEKQGYTLEEYFEDMKKAIYNNSGYILSNESIENGCNKLFVSIREEIENCGYEYLSTLVVLKKLTLEELIYNKEFKISKNDTIGLFNECYGSGSLLEIALEKDLILDREKDIFRIQVEGAKQSFGYSVNETYGLIDSCWK